jgi:hypothetical protein
MKLLALLAALTAAFAAHVDPTDIRNTRALGASAGVPIRFEPDGAMYGHSRPDLHDLRVLDANGEQVPWRPLPTPAAVPSRSVELVARGTQDGVVAVVVDRGPAAGIVDRVELDIPDRLFVGDAEVQGSATGEEGSYARLSSTPIYSVEGAVDARSTTAVFPATDYRYLLVRVTGISGIRGASVARDPTRPPLQPVEASSSREETPRSTVVTLDLGHARVPVDAIQVESSTPRYVRRVTVEGSNDGTSYAGVGGGEVARFQGVELGRVDVAARHRYLRVTIRNGDDALLEGLRVGPEARPRPLLLAEGFDPPYTLLYGSARISPPAYDFERLPPAATGFERAKEGELGPEAANDDFEPPADTRTFFERNDWLVEAALVLAALAVAAAGLLALRRRT